MSFEKDDFGEPANFPNMNGDISNNNINDLNLNDFANNNQGPKYAFNGDCNSAEEISKMSLKTLTQYLQSISKYFNVEFNDVLMKIKGAMIPFNNSFIESFRGKPDLYGPFWIYITIICLLTIIGNYTGYLGHKGEKEYLFNFHYIVVAFMLILGFGFGIPLVIFFLGKLVLKFDFDYIMNLCVYGYSFTVLIPVLVVCIIPSRIICFFALVYFLAHSCAFIFFNMYKLIETDHPMGKFILMGVLGGAQFLLFLLLNGYFLY